MAEIERDDEEEEDEAEDGEEERGLDPLRMVFRGFGGALTCAGKVTRCGVQLTLKTEGRAARDRRAARRRTTACAGVSPSRVTLHVSVNKCRLPGLFPLNRPCPVAKKSSAFASASACARPRPSCPHSPLPHVYNTRVLS